MAMTLEQQRAVALASARKRLASAKKSGLSALETAAGAVTSTAKGIPFAGTYLDEAAAALRAGVVDPLTGESGSFGERFDKYVKNSADFDKKFSGEHPVLSTALPVGMGIYSNLAASGIKGAASLMNPKTPLGMGGLGALEGAAYMSGETPEDRVGGAVMGGATGGVTGFATGKLLNKLFPNKTTGANEFVENYVTNKKVLADKVIEGGDLEGQLRNVLTERGGKSFGENFQFPNEYIPYLKKGGDLLSLDKLRSLESNPDLREGLTKVIADRVPVDFRADYSKAMKLERLDDVLVKAGGDPLKKQTAMRNLVSGRNAKGWTQEEIKAAADAGREGVFKGLATGKTMPVLAYSVQSTPLVGGAVTGARVAANESIDSGIAKFRNTITGDVERGILERFGEGMGKYLNRAKSIVSAGRGDLPATAAFDRSAMKADRTVFFTKEGRLRTVSEVLQKLREAQ